MKKKLESNAGETLIETLCAVIVFTLSILMLSQAVVVAAKVNRNAEDASKPLRISVDEESNPTTTPVPEETSMVITAKDASGNDINPSVTVMMSETKDGYTYYAVKPVS